MVDALVCPHCGAPLSMASAARTQGELWPCLHCGSLLRLRPGAAPTLERTVPPEAMARLRELIFAGKKVEARAFAASVGIDAETIDRISFELMTGVLFGQKLAAVGYLLILGSLGVAAAGAYVALEIHPAGWLLVALGLLFPIPLLRALATSVRMARSPRAVGEIRRVTHLATLPRHRTDVFAFEVLVTPVGAPPFASTLLVPVRSASVHKAVVGARLFVRYDAADRTWMRFDGLA